MTKLLYPRRMRVGEIVCEFMLPARPTKKAVMLCGGMPGLSSKTALMTLLTKKGYAVFNPRYRGTWESGGEFLAQSPENDVREVMDAVAAPIVDVRTQEQFTLKIERWVVMGSSFGGPAALLLASDLRVAKVVALSPVVDWTAPSKEEPMDWLERYIRVAFGEAYRFSPKRWAALSRGEFYQPMAHVKEIPGEKVLMFHAKDDAVVRWNDVEKFAKRTKAALVLWKRGGHLGMNEALEPQVWKRITAHLK